MIFVTVGNLDPFDRLIRAIDEWVSRQAGSLEVIAQIGSGAYKPRHVKFVDFFAPAEYRQVFDRASLVVSHAGMGSIITALEHHKPMIIMPKRACLGEQRNEHQVATARRFRRSHLIQVADDVSQLEQLLASFSPDDSLSASQANQAWPPDETLVTFVRDFVSVRIAS